MHDDLKARIETWGLDLKVLGLDNPLADLGLRSEQHPDAETLRDLIVLLQEEVQEEELRRFLEWLQ